ncbi:MAG: DUF29 domain-containing protein [Synechocystis sp.]|nr:DUF29 domain-containing protein [Synechocystis sp.]
MATSSYPPNPPHHPPNSALSSDIGSGLNRLTTSQLKVIYETDYLEWLSLTIAQLKAAKFEQIDQEHLLEELEDLGREQRRKVDSYLRQLLIHLLLYTYWQTEKDYCARGWESEIDNFRFELELLLKSKTLYNYFLEEINIIYPKARKQALKKTLLPPEIIPQLCPFTPHQLLDTDFFP